MTQSLSGGKVPTRPGADEMSNGYRYYALGLLLLIYTSNFMDRQILNILIEPIKHELNASDTMMGFLAGTVFAIFYATLGMPIAMAADRYSRKNIVIAATTIWSFMTVICGFVGNFWQLALARIGVGVGEAGGSPPSHSMIADMFAHEKRATALAIFALGVPIGILLGFMIGGWINDALGWRWAFIVVGAPGLLIALLAAFTLREPKRGHSDFHLDDDGHTPSFGEVCKFIMTQRSLMHIIMGNTMASFVGYSGVAWGGAFLIRSHGFTVAQAGTALSLIIGLSGIVATFVGGYLSDHLGKNDIAWKSKIVGVIILAMFPLAICAYLTTSAFWTLFFFIFVAFAGTVYLGPSFALTQSLVPLRMRALASAILLFILNLIGLGGGPQLTGILSDLYADSAGNHSMRFALLTITFAMLWSAWHYWSAGKYLKEDLAKVK
ncbi:MAG: MFS transporter [Alphaproteobacteria bacterium]|nr:MAG: MFS transporter [Alphaproteobacteria bacterium]